jgi:membrane protein YdbS with pleckstrin-like domain
MNGQRPFNLQEKEKIVKEIKPLPILRWYFFLRSALVIFFMLIWFIAFIFIPPLLWVVGIPTSFFLIVILIILYFVANNRYNYQHYWITNKRVMYRRGLLGYTINSIPLERISDVIVSRTFWERVFGFGSVHVQSLAGQISYGRHRRLGAEASMLAVSDPEELQRLIFELIKKKRKVEKLTM